ncbi:MAG: FecR domain-containing protein [Acidobacteriota bacterium]|jgi:ferric-dicitrate binding protein FerR (iron transport regulator)|nr:FecR domain-containing protein [Acidobacteriota bacterium]
MTDDKLEMALEAMKNENAPDGEVARAGGRVLSKLDLPQGGQAGGAIGDALCRRFQAQFDGYLGGRLDEAARLLLEDHLGRCPQCRRALARRRDGAGTEPASAIPFAPTRRHPRAAHWLAWAAAIALLVALSYAGRDRLGTALTWGPRATVDAVQGQLFLVSAGALHPGDAVGEGQAVRTGPGSRAVLRLGDGSRVELNERTELALHAAWGGKSVRLGGGDVLVQAAKQGRWGGLRVETRDAVASVRGTVFAVSAGLGGSRVAVAEGTVAVERAGRKELLGPGRQSASDPALAGPVGDAFSWSADADEYLSILASLAEVERQLAALPSQPLRTRSLLLEILPPDVVFYGAIPNIADTVAGADALMGRQAAENPAFGAWLESAGGKDLRALLGRVHDIAHLLGDEVVFGATGKPSAMPFVLAQVRPGRRAELEGALAGLGAKGLHYAMSDDLVSVSDSAGHLARLNASLGEGAATAPDDPFVAALRKRYGRGVGWLLALDVARLFDGGAAGEGAGGAAGAGVKHLMLEQRAAAGGEENELTLAFDGPRQGLASLLADAGSGVAAEYLSRDLLAASYVSTREPRQVFDEMMRYFSKLDPSLPERLAGREARLGVNVAADFAEALGVEYAFGLEGVSTSGPEWVFTASVADPAALDAAIARMAQGLNAQAEAGGSRGGMVFGQERIDGRVWSSLKTEGSPLGAVWTYDRGYMVAAASRGGALRAISARDGGGALVRSSDFQRLFPAAMGLHPAGFAWFDAKGAFAEVARFAENPALAEALERREPVLAVFAAAPEEIRAVSRARMSGVLLDLALMGRR